MDTGILLFPNLYKLADHLMRLDDIAMFETCLHQIKLSNISNVIFQKEIQSLQTDLASFLLSKDFDKDVISLLLRLNLHKVVDTFGRSPVVKAFREGNNTMAFILLSGGFEFECEKYYSDWKEELVEFCKTAKRSWDYYESEIQNAIDQEPVRDIIWEFLTYFPRNQVALAKAKVCEFLEEEKFQSEFWKL